MHRILGIEGACAIGEEEEGWSASLLAGLVNDFEMIGKTLNTGKTKTQRLLTATNEA